MFPNYLYPHRHAAITRCELTLATKKKKKERKIGRVKNREYTNISDFLLFPFCGGNFICRNTDVSNSKIKEKWLKARTPTTTTNSNYLFMSFSFFVELHKFAVKINCTKLF